MTVYLDASVLVSLLVDDSNTAVARRLNERAPLIALSDWTTVECSSALARLTRMNRLTPQERDEIEDALDQWTSRVSRVIAVIPQDFGVGRRFVRQGDSGLRGSDALHLAIAARERLEIATFDLVLARAAAEVGVAVHQFDSA